MYVDTAKSIQRGKTYVRHLLRDSFRENGKVKHRTVANLSSCSKQEIEAIKLALRHKGNLSKLVSIDDIETRQGMRIGAVWFLKFVADRLRLTEVLGGHQQGKLGLWQIFARLIDQGSRMSAVRLAENHAACDLLGLEPFNEDHLYANLSWLAQNQERMEKQLFSLRYGQTPPRLFLYDVTSSYLEGGQNELAAFGYNRDGKKGKMQLVIGLLTDSNGDPVAVRVFEGNTSDSKTVAEQIRVLANSFGVSRVTLVGDRGMLKQTQTDQLSQQCFHYITAITKPQIDGLIRQGTLQLELFEENICEVKADGVRYILRRNPDRAAQLEQNRRGKLDKVNRYAAGKNLYLQEHPRAKVEVAKRNIQSKVNQLKIENWVQVCSGDRALHIVVDEEAKKEKYKFDGCYVIKTDVPVKDAPAEVVHDRYKDLAWVERAFRTFKSGHLEVRPTFVRKKSNTRGHVFVVTLAYLLEREIDKYWNQIEATVAEGIDELSSLRTVEITIANTVCQKVPTPTGLSKKLLDAAEVKLPSVLPLRRAHVATRKKLVDERIKK